MKLSEQVKPISYLKAHAPEVIRKLKVIRSRSSLRFTERRKPSFRISANTKKHRRRWRF
ncbi:hypothetical protein ACQY74_000464 (plasmid) [Rhizobium leguminosarum bv. trifolii]